MIVKKENNLFKNALYMHSLQTLRPERKSDLSIVLIEKKKTLPLRRKGEPINRTFYLLASQSFLRFELALSNYIINYILLSM